MSPRNPPSFGRALGVALALSLCGAAVLAALTPLTGTGTALRARERVVGRIGRVARVCAERRRDQYVEGLHEKEAPEREPGAARALRCPHRERGAEQTQAEVGQRR